jgi:2-keto-3-deoxy-L-rhamnonate aldolase RhmA
LECFNEAFKKSMMYNFRKRLLNEDLLYGVGITLGSPEIPEMLASAGYDWLFIDAEHSPLDFKTILGLLQASGKACSGIIRIPDHQELTIKKALDIGAEGIVVPQVNTAEQAAKIVRFAKYPPVGVRGIGLARVNMYGLNFEETVRNTNNETAVIVQAEHKDVLNHIEDIVKVEGIDAVFIGPYDLSSSFGKAGKVNDPEVVDAIDQIALVCNAANVRLGIYGGSPEYLIPFKEKGFTMFVSSVDISLLSETAIRNLKKLRE